MKSFLQYVNMIFLVVLFLTATTGLQLYSHHCNTTNSSYTHLVKSLANCEPIHESETEVACHTEVNSCCDTKIVAQPQQNDHQCCTDEVVFIQITDDFHYPTGDQQIIKSLLLFDSGIEIFDFETDEEIIVQPGNNEPPPLRSGQELIVFLHQKKIAPHPFA